MKLALSALWIAMLFVFPYVDIFAFFREDVLRAGLNGEISGTALAVDQAFLTAALLYSAVEVVVLLAIARTAWKWRRQPVAS